MAKTYGFDLSCPAANAHEVQWLYFAIWARLRNKTVPPCPRPQQPFLDIYLQRDLRKAPLTEGAQELIDQLRSNSVWSAFTHPEYDELFAGDPLWVTSHRRNGRRRAPRVTKTDYRWLHTLRNLAPSPEPNLTVLWSPRPPTLELCG